MSASMTGKIDKPDRYNAFSADSVNLYNLHRDCDFKQTITEDINLEKPGNKKQIVAYQFTKDKKNITYFPIALTDINQKKMAGGVKLDNIFYVEEVLAAYKAMRQQGKIKEDEITIIPVDLSTKHKSHFNTIVIQRSRIYLIGPPANKTKALSNYPAAGIVNVLENKSESGKPNSIYPVLTDKKFVSGEYHINFCSEITSIENLQDKKSVINVLSSTNLAARNDDSNKLACVGNFMLRKSYIPKYDLAIKIPESDTNLDKMINKDGIPDGYVYGVNDIHEFKYIRLERQFADAASAIEENYIVKSKADFFQSAHTRVNTANWLKEYVNRLVIRSAKGTNINIDPDINAKRDAAVSLLFNYYRAMPYKGGRMAKSIKKALAILLDIQLEFEDIEHKKSFFYSVQTDTVNFTKLIKETINKKYPGVHTEQRKQQNNLIIKLFRYIDDHETSFIYKFDGKERKQKIDKKLEFARKQIMRLSNGEKPEDFNDLSGELKKLIATSSLVKILNYKPSAPAMPKSASPPRSPRPSR